MKRIDLFGSDKGSWKNWLRGFTCCLTLLNLILINQIIILAILFQISKCNISNKNFYCMLMDIANVAKIL